MRCRTLLLSLSLLAAPGCAPRRVAPSPGARASRTIPPARWIASTPAMRSLLRALVIADRVSARLARTPFASSRSDPDRIVAQVTEAREAFREASRAGALLDCRALDDVDFAQTQTEPGSDVWGPYAIAGARIDFVATRSTVTPFIRRDAREAGIAVRSSSGQMMITLGCNESLALVDSSAPDRLRCERYGACPSATFLPLLAGEQVDLEDLIARYGRRGITSPRR
ncbi:MAG: hypothetical protein EPO40_36835 [Myxococcaceae bacterium]|nr:MAG: hypothetical protein EPO40_36835 [Myxococcaceae bacterium]